MKKYKSLVPQIFQNWFSQNCFMCYVCIIAYYIVAAKPSQTYYMETIGNLIQIFLLPWFYDLNNRIISKLDNHIINKIRYFLTVVEGRLRIWLIDLVNQIHRQPGCTNGAVFLSKHQNKIIS